jgi:hypothetical protein
MERKKVLGCVVVGWMHSRVIVAEAGFEKILAAYD